jgi:HEAT repeat protein
MLDVQGMGMPGVEAALRDVSESRPEARAKAATALARVDEADLGRSTTALRILLNDPHPAVRQAAALSLGELRDGLALPMLVDQMQRDEDPMARQAAVIALGTLGDARAVTPIEEALAGGSADVRFQAVLSWAQLASGRSIEPLRRALADPDAEVRGNAAAALGDLGEAGSADLLAACLEDPQETVRIEAAVALARLGDGRGGRMLATYLHHREYGLLAAEHLFRHPIEEAIPALRKLLGRWFGSPLVEIWAAGTLVQLGQDDGRAPLLAALKKRKPMVRGLAIQVLGELHQDWSVQALRELQASPAGQEWREEIAEALGEQA